MTFNTLKTAAPPLAEAGLGISGLAAERDGVPVLFDVSLEVGPGQAVALLGPNGAGKTTTLLAVMGLVRVTAGRLTWDGGALTHQPPHRIAAAGIGWVPEERRVFAGLTVAENIEVGRRPGRPPAAGGDWHDARLAELFPPLARRWRQRAGLLSGGEQQMLAIARTLAGNPRLLLLDEPSEGLAPLIVDQMAAALATIKADGVALLLSEQHRGFAETLADRLVGLARGRVVEGTGDGFSR
ncbi:ABC transporter ATP-binding protein [Roseospirillum parvum]|uniref:ABC transporter ATP-binding protein n=1 Tax=Roseospirillum parvum TaxID=83401 RepID=UPI001FDFA756|nr:ABC transporter ATP-binding protein [Roseospirillum parvum]